MTETTMSAMTDAKDSSKKELEELKVKRNLIFAQLLKNPDNTHLALEIKLIDDQVAEFVRQAAQTGRYPLFRKH